MSKMVSNLVSIIIIVAFIVVLYGITASFINEGKVCQCAGYDIDGVCVGLPHSCVQGNEGTLTKKVNETRKNAVQ